MNLHDSRLACAGIFIMFFAIMSTSFVIPKSTPQEERAKKTRRCELILQELAKVCGLNEIEVPNIDVVSTLKNQNHTIAMYYDEGNPTIQIDEWTYNICISTLGKDSLNGLVFIIAHELAHFIYNHEERLVFEKAIEIDTNDIGTLSKTNKISTKAQELIKRSKLETLISSFREMTSKYNIRKNEAEADLHAGFTAYLAGYDVRDASAKFFDSTYHYFKVDSLKGKYISKEERKIIVEGTAKQLDTLIQVFEMANLLSVSGEYQTATLCYKYMNKIYSSPALLNNIGLALILETMEHLDDQVLPYYLPFTLNTNLVKNLPWEDLRPEEGGGWDSGSETEVPSNALDMEEDPYEASIYKLKSAIQYFKKIQLRHPKNYEAFLNESIANFLITVFNYKEPNYNGEDYIRYAKAAAFKAKAISMELHYDKAISDVYCMLAILDDYTENYEKAVDHYNNCKLFNDKNFLLEKNKHIIEKESYWDIFFRNNKDSSYVDSLTNSIWEEKEMFVGDKPPRTFFTEHDSFAIVSNFNVLLRKTVEGESWVFTSTIFEKGKLFNIELLDNNVVREYYTVFQTNDLYTQSSACGIQIGTDMENLEEKYGKDPKTLQTKSGSYLNYQMVPIENWTEVFVSGTIFYTANSGIVDRWFMYEKKVPREYNN